VAGTSWLWTEEEDDEDFDSEVIPKKTYSMCTNCTHQKAEWKYAKQLHAHAACVALNTSRAHAPPASGLGAFFEYRFL